MMEREARGEKGKHNRNTKRKWDTKATKYTQNWKKHDRKQTRKAKHKNYEKYFKDS